MLLTPDIPAKVYRLPTEKTLEALPDFEGISQRMLWQWVRDKVLVQKVLQQQFPGLTMTEHLVDKVHQAWLDAQIE